MDGDIYVAPYFPDGVKHIITTDGSLYISFVNESTILKYPHFKELCRLLAWTVNTTAAEQTPSYIEFKGEHDDSILLEYAPNRSLEKHLLETQMSNKKKIRITKETVEDVAYVHRNNVLICDIHVRNILLDTEFCIKLCDFHGRLLGLTEECLFLGNC
jgi:serine/threonine protein kinase